MKFAQLISKMGMQMLPAVAASVLSAAVLGALQLTPGASTQTQRGASESGEPIVYVDVMPHINRDPAPPAVASVPPVPAEAPAAPVKAPQVASVPPAAERAARVAATARAEVPAPAPKAEPAAPKPDLAATRLDPVAVTAPAPKVAPAPAPTVTASLTPTPPMPIEAPMQLGPPSVEQTHVFGMAVPQPMSDAGGAVVDVAKLPIQFAGTMVARPVWHVGTRIVSGVAGWIIPGRDR
jgi:hypothetical protein